MNYFLTLKLFISLLWFVLCSIIAIWGSYFIRFKKLSAISSWIIQNTKAYYLEKNAEGPSILVLGDSTAVWIWAQHPNESTAGLLSEHLQASYVENNWVSWALIEDVFSQIQKAKRSQYDYILLQIWGNNMTRFHSLEKTLPQFEKLLQALPPYTHLIVQSCGNLGWAKIFPWFIGIFYERVSRKYNTAFEDMTQKYNGIYVSLFDERELDPYIQKPHIYLAADLFHPSSQGYAYWFEKLVKKLN